MTLLTSIHIQIRSTGVYQLAEDGVCMSAMHHGLDGIHIGAIWRIWLNDSCSMVMWAVAAVAIATCRFI